ncbi:MAG: helix-turn-helix transcriptional regulator, partial [Paludibacteraceae bacterium]|nr:helix-turn-helix transcriptional regulator [Paludibacteraceae bacterium]
MKTEKKVGSKIKSLRESRGVSLEELSEKSGISIAQIELIESDANFPSLAPLIKIARALGTRLGTFLDGESEIGPSVCRKEDRKEG